MLRIVTTERVAAFGVFLIAVLFIGGPVQAGENFKISEAWVRMAPPKMKAHAGYFKIENHGTAERILVGVESPSYAKAEMHVSGMKDGMMMMQRLEQVAIAPGKSAEFKTGGAHIMLVGPKIPQVEGEKVPLTLKFQNGETLLVELLIAKGGMTMDKPVGGSQSSKTH